MNCRCGARSSPVCPKCGMGVCKHPDQQVDTICALCKSPLCAFHSAAKPEFVVRNGRGSTELMTMCYPDCTSAFGASEADPPRVQA